MACKRLILPSRQAVALICAVGLVLALVSVGIAYGGAAHLDRAANGINELPLAALIVVLFAIYVAAVICGIPNAILCISTGAILHTKLNGSLGTSSAVFAGAVALSCSLGFAALLTGGLASYYLGASVLKEWAARLAEGSPVFVALDDALARDGAKLSALMRTSLPHAMVTVGQSVFYFSV